MCSKVCETTLDISPQGMHSNSGILLVQSAIEWDEMNIVRPLTIPVPKDTERAHPLRG
jgi:hypothetical protein